MPRIYVASLSDYNAGRLHGVWIALDGKTAEEVNEEIQAMLKTSPEPIAEEYAIHDSEGFGSYSVSEFASIKELCEVAELISEHGEGLAAGVLSNFFGDVDQAREALTDDYAGSAKSLEDWAEDHITECYDLSSVPEFLRYHIDWQGVARDMKLNGDIYTIEDEGGTVHVFWNR